MDRVNYDEVIADDGDFILTTRDNPYNPFTHWDEWLAFDTEKRYATCELIARLTDDELDPDMPDEWTDIRIKAAIERFIAIDPLQLYCKIYSDGHKEPNYGSEPMSA
jgi:hypothetical protein